MKFVSYAQNYEDVMLWRALRHIEKGFYIDIGANDPSCESVTKAFYERGWRGVNIEPVAYWFEKIRSERPEDINLQVAISNSQQELTFFEVVGTGLSTFCKDIATKHAEDKRFEIREYQVSTKTLTQIYQEYNLKEVHFLKIDVEGEERSVLEGIDFSIIRPWILVVEATLPTTQIESHVEWEHLILEQNYHFVYFDGLNRFYIDDSHAELDVHFLTPPNHWDQFLTSKEVILEAECNHLQVQVQNLSEQNQDLSNQVQDLANQVFVLQKHLQIFEEAGQQRLDLEREAFRQQITAERVAHQRDVQSFNEEYASLREVIRRLDVENTSLQNQKEILTHEIDRLNQYSKHLYQEIEKLDQYRGKLVQQIDLLTADILYWQAVATQRFNELQLIYSSRVWKLTWPLRETSKLMKSLKARIWNYGQHPNQVSSSIGDNAEADLPLKELSLKNSTDGDADLPAEHSMNGNILDHFAEETTSPVFSQDQASEAVLKSIDSSSHELSAQESMPPQAKLDEAPHPDFSENTIGNNSSNQEVSSSTSEGITELNDLDTPSEDLALDLPVLASRIHQDLKQIFYVD